MKSRLRFYGLTPERICFFTLISITAAALEGFGIAMFLPVLEFVEKGQNVSRLVAGSDNWGKLAQVYAALGVNITFFSLLAAAVGAMLLRVLAVYYRQMYSAWLGQEIQHTARSNLFDAYMAMEYGAFSQLSSGTILNVLTTESQRAAGSFSALFALGANIAVVTGFVVVLFWLSVPLTLLALAFLGTAAAVVAYYVRHTRSFSHAATRANNRYSRVALERLGIFRLAKLSAASEREAVQTRSASQDVSDHLYRLAKIISSVDLIMEPMVLLCGGAILFFAVSKFGMNLSEVGVFLLILLRLLPVAKEVVKSRQTFNACIGSLAAVTDSHGLALAARETSGGGKQFSGVKQSIRLEKVTFTYPNSSGPALFNFSVEIPAGRITALVGPSGGGKSTLADIVPRLRVPQLGRVLYDGVDGGEFNLGSLRRGIAFVSQDSAMLDDSVAENLRFVRPGATEAELWEVLTSAQAASFVRDLPDGINTSLGERGTRLSGGQKQRLSLARALLQKTSVLILDEPTSALDYETEQGIQAALEDLRAKGECTVIIIAHRLSTIRKADKIVVLQAGCLTEQGMHEELAVNEDWYSRAAGLQIGGS